jgi:hypothetical protein
MSFTYFTAPDGGVVSRTSRQMISLNDFDSAGVGADVFADDIDPYSPSAEEDGSGDSASRKTEASSVDDGTQCPVCLDVMRNARVPPCGHAVCAACLKTLTSRPQRTSGVYEFETGMMEAPTGPKCPVCKVPIHKSMYMQCYALDKAIEKMHPCSEQEKKEAGKAANHANPETLACDKWTSDDLHQWQLADGERLAQAAIKLVVTAIQECSPASDALLINESAIPNQYVSRAQKFDCGHPTTYVGARRRFVADIQPVCMDAPTSQADATITRAWSTLWRTPENIAERLRQRGLTVDFFRFNDERYGLIRWAKEGHAAAMSSRPKARALDLDVVNSYLRSEGYENLTVRRISAGTPMPNDDRSVYMVWIDGQEESLSTSFASKNYRARLDTITCSLRARTTFWGCGLLANHAR